MSIWLKRVILAATALLAAILLVTYYESALAFLGDIDRMRDWLLALGPLGPLGLIALNAMQVVLAPVPGYFVQIAAGYLFGWLSGAIYGALGMAVGGALAMTLARVYGRPLVRRVVGARRLARWEQVTRLDSLLIWFVLMLGPFGDAPYYVAGLTRLAVWKIVAVALVVRAPSVAVAAAVGAGVISWRSPWVIGGAIVLMSLAVIGLRYQDRIEGWVDDHLLRRALGLRAALGREDAEEQPGPLDAAEEAG